MNMSDTPRTDNSLTGGEYNCDDLIDCSRALECDLTAALARIEDMLMCDDGQAWKEARKFVERLKANSHG